MQLPSLSEHEQIFQQIQSHLTPQTLGVLWLTNGQMAFENKPFVQLDYLFDGVLTKFLNDNEMANNSSFFIGNQFGKPFFLGQSDYNDEKFESSLAGFLTLMKPKAEERQKILVINHEKSAFPVGILKKFSNFKFEHVTIN